MATNYPTSIDSFTNPTSGDTLDSPSHAAQHANINDAMVAVQTKLGVGSGTIGTWTTYTPTWTNLTVGNGTIDFVYCQINKVVHINGLFTLGSTSSIGANPYFTLPVNRYTTAIEVLGVAALGDLGTGVYSGVPLGLNTNDRCYLYRADHTVGSTVIEGAINSTSPMNWTTNDYIHVNLTYRAA